MPAQDAPPTTPLADLATRQRAAAESAERQSRWAEALWAWDVLRALRPEDAEVVRRRGLAQDAAQAGVADRLQRARLAMQRADSDLAARLYLDALALSPGQAEAANGLRAIERERVKRQHLGQLSRNTMTRRSTDPAQSLIASAAGKRPASGASNEVEHASLLAAQGEIAGAIAVLTPLVAQSRADPAARSLLADLHFRQAETQLPSDRAAAVASMQRSLQLAPSNAQVAARLKQLSMRSPPLASVTTDTKTR